MDTRKIRPLAGLFLLFSLLITTLSIRTARRAQAGPHTLPLEDYWRLVASIREGLQPEAVSPQERRELADRLDSIPIVELPDGSLAPVEMSYLSARLRDPATGLDALRLLFDSLLEWRDAHPPGSVSAADLEGLQAILSRAEFQWPQETPNPVTEFFRRIYRWFLEQLSRIMPAASRAGPLFRAFLTVLLGAALAWILVVVYRNSMRSMVHESEVRESGALPRHMSSEEARRQAVLHSSEGDLRSAVRYLYLAALFTLEENGHVRPDRSRTNREYLADLAGRPDLRDRLQRVVHVFDRVWYGYQPLDEGAYRRYSESVDQLRRLHRAV